MRRTSLLASLFSVALVICSTAEAATIQWNIDNVTTAATSVPPSSGTPVSNLTVSDLTRGNASGALVSNASSSSGYTGASGVNNVVAAAVAGTLNVTNSTYFTFTLTPSGLSDVLVTGISFGERSTATGPIALDIRSSLDNFTTSIGTAVALADSNWHLYTPTLIPTTSAVDTAITFRIYGSGGSSAAGGNFRLDDITLTYTLLSVPEPSTWAMMIAGAGLLGAGQWLRRKRS
jgi:hypothetical protein